MDSSQLILAAVLGMKRATRTNSERQGERTFSHQRTGVFRLMVLPFHYFAQELTKNCCTSGKLKTRAKAYSHLVAGKAKSAVSGTSRVLHRRF